MKVDWLVSLLLLLGTALIEGSEGEEFREKRQIPYPPPLVYPFGGNFKLIVGLAVPVQLSGRILVYGQNVQFQYALPDNATFFANLLDGWSRRQRRSATRNERMPIYEIIEREFDRRNIDGRACLKKDICEAAATSAMGEGLVGELLHLLLAPDEGDTSTMDAEFLEAAAAGRKRENCSTIYSTCPPGMGILDRISTVY